MLRLHSARKRSPPAALRVDPDILSLDHNWSSPNAARASHQAFSPGGTSAAKPFWPRAARSYSAVQPNMALGR